MPDSAVPSIDAHPHRRAFPTRWNDNDVFGHVNNTIYYAAMDTTVTSWFGEVVGLDPFTSDWIAVVVSSSCRFHRSAVFPDVIEVGMRATRIGRTSCTWAFTLVRQDDHVLLATGEFVHVFVAREGDRRPVPVPDHVRDLVERTLLVPDDEPAAEARATATTPVPVRTT